METNIKEFKIINDFSTDLYLHQSIERCNLSKILYSIGYSKGHHDDCDVTFDFKNVIDGNSIQIEIPIEGDHETLLRNVKDFNHIKWLEWLEEEVFKHDMWNYDALEKLVEDSFVYMKGEI